MPRDEVKMRVRELQLMAQRYADQGEQEKANQALDWCQFQTSTRGDETDADACSADPAFIEQSERPS